MTATVTIAWATLKYDPKPPEPSRNNPEWGTRHFASAQVDGYEAPNNEARLYFAPGVLSALQKDDTVLVEWDKGKWKMAKQQTPELIATLQQRQPTTPSAPQTPAAIAPTAQSGESPQAVQPSQGQVKRQVVMGEGWQHLNLEADVKEVCSIVNQLHGAIPGFSVQDLRSMAIAIHMERGRCTRTNEVQAGGEATF
jgi:hypothetical protein